MKIAANGGPTFGEMKEGEEGHPQNVLHIYFHIHSSRGRWNEGNKKTEMKMNKRKKQMNREKKHTALLMWDWSSCVLSFMFLLRRFGLSIHSHTQSLHLDLLKND